MLPLEDRCLLSTFDVTSAADDGSIGTLRWAVQQADAATTPSTIDFHLGSAPATITLARGKLELSNTAEPTTITGPGAGRLTINGNRADGVFQIDQDGLGVALGLDDHRGSTGNHGGGVNNSGSLMLSGCTISGNSSQYGGGLLLNEGTATLTELHDQRKHGLRAAAAASITPARLTSPTARSAATPARTAEA